MSASVHRIADILDPVQSAFSPEQKAAILREARETAAAARESIAASSPLPRPDPVAKWRAEVDQREREMECEREIDRREQEERRQKLERQARRQRRDATMAWQAHLEKRLESERDFMVAVLGEIVAEFEAKVAKLEIELRELKK